MQTALLGLVRLVEPAVRLVELAAVLEGLAILRELDRVLRTVKVRQGLHPAAAAAAQQGLNVARIGAVLAGLAIPQALDQVMQTVKVQLAQHPAAAAAVATRHVREMTTVAVVEMVRRVASCSRIRQQQAADEDGEYS